MRRSFLCSRFHIRKLNADARDAKLSTVIMPDTANVLFGREYLLVDTIEFLLVNKKICQFVPVLSNMLKAWTGYLGNWLHRRRWTFELMKSTNWDLPALVGKYLSTYDLPKVKRYCCCCVEWEVRKKYFADQAKTLISTPTALPKPTRPTTPNKIEDRVVYAIWASLEDSKNTNEWS